MVDRVRDKWTLREYATAAKGSFRMPDGTIIRKNRYGPVAPDSAEMTPAELDAEMRSRRDDALRRAFA